jgi:poly-beta-1,6-N-acetyl-D-glucosamine synthase
MIAPAAGRRYVLISPCRNEAAVARYTLESVAAQTVPPALWVIVDDGSTDATPAILAEYAARLDFIRIVRRENRGRRSVGPGVIEAFYAGYQTIDPADFDYVCKLDLDLELPPRYFELLLRRMEAEPRLGTCSGKPYYRGRDGGLVSEGCGDETSIGASKFYRMECFQQLGGFVRAVMWDGVDCHRCRMLGWMARSWDDPELRFLHLRPMGSSEKGILTGRLRHGRGQYFLGTGLAYMTASAIYRMARRPFMVGGLAMWWGYVWSLLRRAPRYEEPGFRRFLRRYQWDCLLRGKAAATRRLDERQAAVWRPVAPNRALSGRVAARSLGHGS